MDNFNYAADIINRVKWMYFKLSAKECYFWIKRYGSRYLSDEWRQVLQEYEDDGLNSPTLCINIIGDKEVIIRVSYDNHLLVWRFKKCS